MLQGVISPAVVTTPTNGLVIASSSTPIARMNALWGTLSIPSVVILDLNLVYRPYGHPL